MYPLAEANTDYQSRYNLDASCLRCCVPESMCGMVKFIEVTCKYTLVKQAYGNDRQIDVLYFIMQDIEALLDRKRKLNVHISSAT